MVGGSSHWKIRSHSMDVMGSDSEDSLKYGFGEGPAKTPNRASRFTGVDRISKPLKNGMSVSASLRPITKGGELRFVVDINIDPLGTIRWPTPTWFRGLETQVKDIVSKHEKTGGKLLQESRNAQVEGGGSEQAQGKWSLPLRSIPKEPERVAQDNASYKGRDEGVYAARDWTGVPEEIVMEWSRKLEPFPSLERYEDGKDF
ncbi:hypothetical protein BDZ45DRAFT_676957 [Acephala macrosclerotiorum]|nr:hypothetical protein BDZ45DRAFT_676957 [Acephala macrosclerotiorum]